MTTRDNYWKNRTLTRRTALAAAAVGGGWAALGLAGCSSTNNKNNAAKPTSATARATSGAAATGAVAATSAARPATAGSPTPAAAAVIDSTTGKPGGLLKAQCVSAPGNFLVAASRTGNQFRGLVHSGLLAFKMGRPGLPGTAVQPEPDLAQALPEQPDPLTYTFKLKPGVKFQNGRVVTAADIAYSYNRYANADVSVFRTDWFWFDSAQAPDPQTVVVKTKSPFADALLTMSAWLDAFILAKEYEESPDAATKPMGSGPYIFDNYNTPVDITFHKNPDYFTKPYPYFDQVQLIITADAVKKITDFTSRNIHVTWWYDPVSSDQVKQGRPDAQAFRYIAGGFTLWNRTDIPPLNDKRIRQALSMTIDRKAIRDSVSKGFGEDDQALSYSNMAMGYRKPSQLGDAAKYWNFDPQTAKQLLAAAGVTKPIETTFSHLPASVDGQAPLDMATLIQAKWKELGIADMTDMTVQSAQYNSTANVGDYTGIWIRPSPTSNQPVQGSVLRSRYWSPPEGIKAPTTNVCHVNDQQLSPLLDKQLTQFKADERLQTIRAIEDNLAENQYLPALSVQGQDYYADPTVKDIVMPLYGFLGGSNWYKYWWFDKT